MNDKKKRPAYNPYRIVKRILDIWISLFAIAAAALPMLIISLLIRKDSSGGALFRQTRVGRNGRHFICYKFRTMTDGTPASCATNDLENAESYITGIGRFLRDTSLDELPQLFNILKGDMSLIGPRPLIPEETEVHALRKAAGVYALRPGLTGYAQINGRDSVSPEKKAEMDAWYLCHLSFSTDLRILFSSVLPVLLRKDIHEGRS